MQFLRLIFSLAILVACNGDCNNDPNFPDRCGIENIFNKIGFSPSCVSQTLSTCEKQLSIETLLNDLKTQFILIQESVHQLTLKKDRFLPRNCLDLYNFGDKLSGVRTVYPFNCKNRPVFVFCDQITDGGGWTVFQHRRVLPVRELFYRNWLSYQLGFGNLTGEFWLGLENIRALVSSGLFELRVDLLSFEDEERFAKYEYFYIGDVNEKYILHLGNYSGNAGDAMTNANGQKFSTYDQDNDGHETDSCSKKYRGGWWYNNCHFANLNGLPYQGKTQSLADGIVWQPFKGYKYSLSKVTMAVRQKYVT